MGRKFCCCVDLQIKNKEGHLIKLIIHTCAFLYLFVCNFTVLAEETTGKLKKLTLATTKWCPYTCFDNSKEFGVVGLYLRKIISSYDVELAITSYPWSRAIRLVESKKIDGLLTATHTEAPALIFTDSPIGSYQMCFYTLSSNKWIFSKSFNFGVNLLAVVQDYGYGEPLDSYIKSNALITSISGSNVTDRLISLLLKERVDVIVADKLVVDYKISNKLINANIIKQAGCLTENYFYLALNPTIENKKLLKKLSYDLTKPENIKFFNNLKLEISKNH